MDINKVIKSAQDKCKIEYGKELSTPLLGSFTIHFQSQ